MSEILIDCLNQTQVECCPLIAVAIGIAVFTALRQHCRGNRPVFAERRGAVTGNAPCVGSRTKCAIRSDTFNLCAQTMTIKQSGFTATVAQAVETVVMQAEQRMTPVFAASPFTRFAVAISYASSSSFARRPLTIICSGPAK